MINYKLLNKSKMKNYLSNRVGYKVSEFNFNNCIEYIVDFAEYINDMREGNKFIKEGASLEIVINNEILEVLVNYNFVLEKGIEIVLIDFDYRYKSMDEILNM